MNGHRQAAVALFGLAAHDQERILAELPHQDQRILNEFLAELTALGFDKAANMADAVAPLPLASVAAPSDPAARLRGAAPAEVYAAIAHEPASLIAQLLSAGSWPWADAVLGLLPQPKRKLVGEALHAGIAEAPARTRFLIAAVSGALRPAPAAVPAVRARRLPALLSKYMPWTR